MKLSTAIAFSLSLALGALDMLVPSDAQANPLNGTYVIKDSKQAQKTIDQAIERTVSDVSRLFRGKARDALKSRQRLCPKLSLAIASDATITCVTAGRSVSAPSSGASKKVKGKDGKTAHISHKPSGNRLVQTIKGENGTSKVTYTLSADGKTLTLSVHMSSSKLDTPLRFSLTYIRS
ncbi:MAG: hypothetical protein AAGC55_20170 [Myxococcota bacterium]